MPPFLGALLDDPYDVVRIMAYRSLDRLRGFEDFEYDVLAEPPERRLAARRALDEWTGSGGAAIRPAVLIGERGELEQAEFLRLQAERDDRPIQLVE
jgi:hypothetical protein